MIIKLSSKFLLLTFLLGSILGCPLGEMNNIARSIESNKILDFFTLMDGDDGTRVHQFSEYPDRNFVFIGLNFYRNEEVIHSLFTIKAVFYNEYEGFHVSGEEALSGIESSGVFYLLTENNGLGERLTFEALMDQGYFGFENWNNDMKSPEFVFFDKLQLTVLAEQVDDIYFSGTLIDYGDAAGTDYEGQAASGELQYPTLKAESLNSISNTQTNSSESEENIGLFGVVAGTPCPPIWDNEPALETAFVVDTQVKEKDKINLLKKIQKQWNEFARSELAK